MVLVLLLVLLLLLVLVLVPDDSKGPSEAKPAIKEKEESDNNGLRKVMVVTPSCFRRSNRIFLARLNLPGSFPSKSRSCFIPSRTLTLVTDQGMFLCNGLAGPGLAGLEPEEGGGVSGD